MEIKITRDTLSDIYFDALRIRNTVFVKEQGVAYELEVGDALEEASSVHFVLYDGEIALGTVRILADLEQKTGLLQRMAILKEYRGKGYAPLLINRLLDFAQEMELQSLSLHAQLSVRAMYIKFGFAEVGEIFEEAGIEHITMIKNFK